MKKRCRVIALLLCAIIKPICANGHRLIISVSLPCSLSVAFLRMMRQRGDFLVLHEPGVPAWFQQNYPGARVRDRYKHEPLTFSEVADQIKMLASEQNVFVKEESHAAKNYLDEPGILDSCDMHTVFLLRNPHHVLLSIYYKTKYEVSDFLVNYEEMLSLYKRVESKGMHRPYIIHVDDLVKNPEKTIKDFCSYANIPFKKEALQWDDLSHNFNTNIVWYDNPYARFHKDWHGNALKSTSFVETTKMYHVDEQGIPTFEEIESAAIRAHYIKVYQKTLPAYEEFMQLYQAQIATYRLEH